MALEKILKNSSGVPTGEYERIAGGTLYADSPIGTIVPFGGLDDKIPSGWLKCNGREFSRSTYSELFAVIGTAFGSGDGSTTFNIPDMREAVPKGAGLTGKSVGAHLDADGLAVGEFLDDRMQSHSHEETTKNGQTGTSENFGGVQLGNVWGENYYTDDNTGRRGATTEVKSVGVNYIIKAKMVAIPADFLAKVDEIYGDSGLCAHGDNEPFMSGQTIRNYLLGLDSSIKFATFTVDPSASTVTDKINTTEFCSYNCYRQGASWRVVAINSSGNEMYISDVSSSTTGITWEKVVTESDLTPTQITGIVKADNDYTVNVYKSGNVVTVTFNSNKESAWALSQQLASGLPIPVGNAYHGMIMLTDGRITGLSVSGSGVLEVGYPTTSTGWLFGSITYICQ